jgi:hypothetical protein
VRKQNNPISDTKKSLTARKKRSSMSRGGSKNWRNNGRALKNYEKWKAELQI